jgi:hypothetical protein
MLFQKKPDERLRLVEVMRLRKACLPDPLTPYAAHYFEEAKRRCLACKVKPLCDEALAAGDAKGFSLFCPNTHYIAKLSGGRALSWRR